MEIRWYVYLENNDATGHYWTRFSNRGFTTRADADFWLSAYVEAAWGERNFFVASFQSGKSPGFLTEFGMQLLQKEVKGEVG